MNMKAAIPWSVALLAASAGAYLLGRYGRAPTPGAVDSPAAYVGFEPAEVDLGEQPWGTVLPVEVTFVNNGSAAVTVQSVTSSCDCVMLDAGSYEQRTIQAGEALTLPLTFEAGQYREEKHRTIELTATSGQKYDLSLFVSVYGTWSLTPDSLDLGEVVLGDPDAPDVEATFTFVSETDEQVGEPEVAASRLRCFAAQRGESTTTILVRLLKDELPPGVSTAHIVLPRDPRVTKIARGF